MSPDPADGEAEVAGEGSPDEVEIGGHRGNGAHAAGIATQAAIGHHQLGLELGALPPSVDIYDTTLRDGSQQEGLSLTVDDKLRVAEQLDHLGVAFIEGGWPGANPKDDEFFRRAPVELALAHAELVAFGSTRRPRGVAETDETLRKLIGASTEAVCIVAKSSEYQVTEALRTTLDEGRAMAADSVRFLRAQGRRVFFDAEHFFDGYRLNPGYSLSILEVAAEAGAEVLVLCDTNGGSLPHQVDAVVRAVRARIDLPIGVHFHNDSGCAVANTLAGVQAGAVHVQGCINGYGERTGNADLCATIPNLSLKLGIRTIPSERLERLMPVSHHIAELVNMTPNPQQPYVGSSAFAHKAGLHVSAIVRTREAYEHVPPESVGNGARFVVSELAGRSTLAMKAAELGLEIDGAALGAVLEHLKRLEHLGYHFEAADGSLELLLREASGWRQDFFRLESFRVTTEQRFPSSNSDAGSDLGHDLDDTTETTTEATVKVHVGGERILAVAEGDGPVHALDAALRKAVAPYFASLSNVHLTDFRVRVLDSSAGTAAVTRVLIDSTDGNRSWSTIGVSGNIIEASWQALADSIVYGLLVSGLASSGTPGETADGGGTEDPIGFAGNGPRRDEDGDPIAAGGRAHPGDAAAVAQEEEQGMRAVADR